MASFMNCVKPLIKLKCNILTMCFPVFSDYFGELVALLILKSSLLKSKTVIQWLFQNIHMPCLKFRITYLQKKLPFLDIKFCGSGK